MLYVINVSLHSILEACILYVNIEGKSVLMLFV